MLCHSNSLNSTETAKSNDAAVVGLVSIYTCGSCYATCYQHLKLLTMTIQNGETGLHTPGSCAAECNQASLSVLSLLYIITSIIVIQNVAALALGLNGFAVGCLAWLYDVHFSFSFVCFRRKNE